MSLELLDIMGEDLVIWANRQDNGDINVYIENEDDICVFDETSHRAAWDSLVYFARQVIEENERIEREELEND